MIGIDRQTLFADWPMLADGLQDDGWAINRTAAGVLVADPVLFPPSAPGKNDGMKLVADYIHERGLKFGIYTARGSLTCLKRPGSDSHEQIDADTWAAWGVVCGELHILFVCPACLMLIYFLLHAPSARSCRTI